MSAGGLDFTRQDLSLLRRNTTNFIAGTRARSTIAILAGTRWERLHLGKTIRAVRQSFDTLFPSK